MSALSLVFSGAAAIFEDPLTILYFLIGVFGGIVFGAIPGLTGALGVSLMLPFTFAMSPTQGITVLIGIYVGGVSGGLIASIMLNIPGNAAAIVTCFDGSPMARNGRPYRALSYGATASLIGGLFSGVVMIFVATKLARFGLMFGAWEYFALGIMGLAVVISNRLVCFDIKGLGKNLKKPGMLIVQDAVWNTVTINRAIGRSTWYFVDEFHLLLKEEQTAAYSAEIWKRFRKWGGIPTGATQNPKDLLSSPEIENILENSDFIYMLNQAAGDRKILAERLNISSEQLAYVTNSEPGHGLLFFNNVILPFADDFPKDTELYKLLTTKPSEVAHETVDDEKEDQNG